MAIALTRTSEVVANSGVKCLVYGFAGAGKTTLAATLPSPVILSSESGLLSVQEYDLPYIEINTMADLVDACTWAQQSSEAKDFQSLAIDSISDIAEVVLSHEKKQTKDPRKAYGALQEQMADIVRAFRDISGKHVYMTAKIEKSQDEAGRMLYAPSMPGNKLAQQLPYFFDEVLALRVEKDAEGKIQRALMCDTDGLWSAKDRSGKLDMWEEPNLGSIISKIVGA